MQMLTYGLKTPRDLFEKLKRDGILLHDEVTSDKFFNFVITGYSLIDWLKREPTVAQRDVVAMYQDFWITICGELANASKHFSLTKSDPVTSKAESHQDYGVGRYGRGQRRATTRPCCEDHRHSEKCPDPPRGYDSPADAQQGWRLSMKDWRMKNSEVLDTDSCRELVVNNPVEHRSEDASGSDFKSFHRVVGTDRIVAVVKSPLSGS
jgi:hypothetical protein